MKKFIIIIILSLLCTFSRAQDFLTQMNHAIANNDLQEVEYLISQHGGLSRKEQNQLAEQAFLTVEAIKSDLEEPFYPPSLTLGLCSLVIPLSVWLGHEQIPRLQGKVVERTSPCMTYAGAITHLGIAVIGGITGAVFSVDALKRLMSDPKQLEQSLIRAQAILKLINESYK